ncbi:type II secretion system protein [Vibrio lentus]|uniref:Type II secretion system protein n=1 Tax=Vibrio lentus TaxID=136468 RepID=A0A2N7KP26_9VIBR|nr:hypothetical protein [Vibrio lentus]PMM78455.1 hypothetical protein BCT49_00150 [Vibrio lentus]
MMNYRKKQGGFVAAISMLLIMGIATMAALEFSTFMTTQRIKSDVNSFYNRILYLEQQMHAYATTQYQTGVSINSYALYPRMLSDLEGDYIPECSEADSRAGTCWRYDETPWGEVQGYQRIGVPIGAAYPDFYRAELTIPLQDTGLESYHLERNVTLQMFSQLPNVIFDEAKNTLTLRIERPDKAFAYDGLVKRSGDDSTLLGDWDLGGLFGITNARDYMIAGVGGGQISVSKRLVTIEAVSHGQIVKKPTCSKDLLPNLTLSFSESPTYVGYDYVAGFKSYIQSQNSNAWTVGVDTTLRNSNTKKLERTHYGKATASVQCI